MELVKTMETPDGKKLYQCPFDGWIEGIMQSETGYIVCPQCGTTLDTDPLSDLEDDDRIEDDPDTTKPIDG